MINTESMPQSSIVGLLVATAQRALETVTELSALQWADLAGKPGLEVLQPSVITGEGST